MQNMPPSQGLSEEHRRILQESEYGRDFLRRWDEQAELYENLSDPRHPRDLRRIADACFDERLRVIAAELEAGVRYVPNLYLRADGWASIQIRLEDDRGRPGKRVRALERSNLGGKGVTFWERRAADRARRREEHRVTDDTRSVAGVDFAGKDDVSNGIEVGKLEPDGGYYRLRVLKAVSKIPFPKLDERRRRTCLAALGGELKARLVLLKFLNLNHVAPEFLGFVLQTAEQSEAHSREERDGLWELLQGARRLAAEARGLEAPPDVLVTLDAWHMRVLDLAYGLRPILPQVAREMRRVSRERGLPEKVATRDTRHRQLRRQEERRLLKGQFTPEELATLQLAWVPAISWAKSGTEAEELDTALAQGPRPETTLKAELRARVRALKRLTKS